eukprot:scaffold106066_cov19-Tisochrysis_lutea.AAC.2
MPDCQPSPQKEVHISGANLNKVKGCTEKWQRRNIWPHCVRGPCRLFEATGMRWKTLLKLYCGFFEAKALCERRGP